VSGQPEPGRHVTDDGRIIYHWPPEGRYANLWQRIELALPGDDEKLEAEALLARWRDETSTLLAHTDDNDQWVDVEPDWDLPARWLAP